MNFNFSEVLTRAWQITWKHKILWTAGFASMLMVFLIFPIMFVPMFAAVISNNPSRWFESPLFWIGMGVGFLFFIALSYGIGSLVRPMMVVGAVKAERGAERLSFIELLSEGKSFFWRFLSLMLLFGLGAIIVSSVFSAIQIFGSIITLGLASICLMPLSFLMYPFIFIAAVLLEFSEMAIVVEGLGVMAALRRGWEVLRTNKMTVFVMMLIMYVGLGMVSTIFILPIFFPMMFMPMFMIDESLPRQFLWIIGICSVAFFPIMAFVQGIVTVLMKTSWVLTYLRLTQKPETFVVMEAAQPA
jgi:hypothetical protein